MGRKQTHCGQNIRSVYPDICLLGAQGCGAVVFGKGIEPKGLVEGGNGVSSLEKEMKGDLPERLEAGTLPAPAIVGLSEGARIVEELGIERIAEHERALFRLCRDALERIDGVRVLCPSHEGSVLLFEHERFGSEELAARLSDMDICVRGGYHCCALGHRRLGTVKDGATRVSFGVFNSSDDVERLCEALESMK